MILDLSIANGLFLIFSGILFQEKNLKGALENQMISILFGDNGSIIMLLLENSTYQMSCLETKYQEHWSNCS